MWIYALARFCNWSGVSGNGFLGLYNYYIYGGIEMYCRYLINEVINWLIRYYLTIGYLIYLFVFTLRQPVGWLNWYHPSIDYDFFLSYPLDKEGSTTISLKEYPNNCWIKMEWVSSLYRVCTISICFNHTHVSSRVVSIYLWYKAINIIPDDHSFIKTLNFPIISTSTSYTL